MARIEFTYKCGHEGETSHYNKSRGARYAKQQAENLCPECSRILGYENIKAQAEKISQEQSLIDLTGVSEKQIAYGNVCRVKNLDFFNDEIECLTSWARKLSDQAKVELNDAIALISLELSKNTSAKFWIEERFAATRIRRWRDGYLYRSIIERDLAPTFINELNSK